MRRWVVLVALAVLACEDKKAEGELTIVVEADKSKIQSEERLLDAKKESLQAEQRRLAAEQQEIQERKGQLKSADLALKKKLEDQEAEMVARSKEILAQAEALEGARKELARQKDALLARAAGAVPAADPGVDARERALALREQAIAAREAEVAVREKSMAAREADVSRREKELLGLARPLAAAPAEPAPPPLSPKALEARHRELLAGMEKRGLLVSDLPLEAQGHNRDIFECKRRGDWARATQLVNELGQAAAAVKVDRVMVERKMARLTELRGGARLAADIKAEVDRLFQAVTQQYNDSLYEKANKDMNRIALLLEGR